jgi:hypothetical protein
MAVVVNEFEVVPERAKDDKAPPPAAPPPPAPADELETRLRTLHDRAQRLRAT